VFLSNTADEFGRTSALQALTFLAATGGLPGFDMRAFLLETLPVLEPRGESYVWTAWADAVAHMGFGDLIPDVEKVFESGFIDELSMSLNDFRDIYEDLQRIPDMRARLELEQIRPFGSTIETLSGWAGFKPIDEPSRQPAGGIPMSLFYSEVNPYRDVGRNDPCPCGSGKKFKKCCLGSSELSRNPLADLGGARP
jgi:hypothetical protein